MNLNVDSKVRQFFDRFFWRQHPEAALRYSPVVSQIKRLKLEKSKILEIGSGSLGMVPYLKTNIDGIDVDFSGPKTSLLNKIKGTASDLPFRKNSYDVVISVDVLEHLSKDIREKSILEMLRVAKKLAVIVVPTGQLSEAQDLKLQSLWKRVFGTVQNQFLEEHVKNGLPSADSVLVSIDKSLRKLDKKAKIASHSSLNLNVRYILMRTWISKNKLFYYLYMKGFLLLLPLLKFANFSNCYRTVFVIEFTRPANSHLETYSNRIEKSKGKNSRGAS